MTNIFFRLEQKYKLGILNDIIIVIFQSYNNKTSPNKKLTRITQKSKRLENVPSHRIFNIKKIKSMTLMSPIPRFSHTLNPRKRHSATTKSLIYQIQIE